eukprot:m.51906 g.51906  ORF g.51906 m.51906 type:complete len:467 (+) comp11267_c0_seq1:173-1573(+)
MSRSPLTREEVVERLDALVSELKYDPREAKRPLRVVGLGAGAWGSVFIAMLQEMYVSCPDLVDVRIWRRGGRAVSKDTVTQLMTIINADEAVLKRLRTNGVYLKYVSARLGDREMAADELLADGFCLNLPQYPLCPMKVLTDLDEAVYDADLIVCGVPSTETRAVFEQVGKVLGATRDRGQPMPVVISLSKGVEVRHAPQPHIITPTRIIHETTRIPLENLFYLGGPNIASEIWRGEYANARICGPNAALCSALANLIRNPNFVVWSSEDVITHEVLGGLKNVYAIGMGITTAATNNSATSKAVYFSNATAEMVFITRLLSEHPDELQGPLLADTYVTLIKGRNAWYGEQVGNGLRHPRDGAVVPGKGLIQGVSAVHAFFDLLSDKRVQVPLPGSTQSVCAIELLPTMQMLKRVLSYEGTMKDACAAFISELKDASATDPAQRLKEKGVFIPFLTHLPTAAPSSST